MGFSISNVKAHVVVETYSPDYVFNPKLDSSIVNANANWGSGYIPTSINNSSPWLTNVGQFEYKSNLNGIYLNVEADFYLGIAFNTNDSAVLNNWLTNTRNTLTANNLRCGIGSAFKSGYDSSYAPIVSNFSVTLYEGMNSTGNYLHYVYHIKYQYNQQIAKVTNLNSNVSCWFERNPDNGLFAQIVNFAGITEFSYYNKTFNFNVSADPNTAILDGIQSGINGTNDRLDDILDSDISDQDKELPDDSSYQDYGDAEGQLKDKVSQADLTQLSIGMDAKSSSWVWDTLTSFIQSHTVVFGLFIGMLSIGIIKLALGR